MKIIGNAVKKLPMLKTFRLVIEGSNVNIKGVKYLVDCLCKNINDKEKLL